MMAIFAITYVLRTNCPQMEQSSLSRQCKFQIGSEKRECEAKLIDVRVTFEMDRCYSRAQLLVQVWKPSVAGT